MTPHFSGRMVLAEEGEEKDILNSCQNISSYLESKRRKGEQTNISFAQHADLAHVQVTYPGLEEEAQLPIHIQYAGEELPEDEQETMQKIESSHPLDLFAGGRHAKRPSAASEQDSVLLGRAVP